MRADFFQGLHEVLKKDDDVVLLTSDTGALVLDDVRKTIASRCINVGIAELNMISVAAGLALCGKTVYVYAIIPFVTLRCFEHYRVDVCATNLNVKAIGVGAGLDYCTLGPTHHAHEDIAVMRTLPGLTILSPSDEVTGKLFAKLSYDIPGPVYVRLERYGQPLVYPNAKEEDFKKGLNVLRKGNGSAVIIATGKMVVTALKAAETLKKQHSIDVSVVDLYRIKPLNTELMIDVINQSKEIFTLEEHSIIGGVGSIISDLLVENRISKPLRKIGLPDDYCRRYGTRDYLHGLIGIDAENVTKIVKNELGK
ncbi:MAG: hypothetical protein A2252_03045 [Elusimicrobia bacterium RIFOXYA2_FULL_39_19]|nr:MAG: hypothetical protein A2252_03045 [Elusimicrobia bacterium RIFOXYA2_FULL_39_19]